MDQIGALKGPFRIFNIFIAKQQKMKGEGHFEVIKIFRKKVSQFRNKTERGDPLVSPGIVCCAEKNEQLFWLSSLGQMVQFDIL